MSTILGIVLAHLVTLRWQGPQALLDALAGNDKKLSKNATFAVLKTFEECLRMLYITWSGRYCGNFWCK